MDMQTTIDQLAHHIAEHGTTTMVDALETLAQRVAGTHPGASEALIDWDGPEVARLRAFSIVVRALQTEPSAAAGAGPGTEIESRPPRHAA